MKVKAIFGTHAIYTELVNHPPKGVDYVGSIGKSEAKEYYVRKKKNRKFNQIFKFLRLPRFFPLKGKGYGLVHTSRGLLPLQLFSKKPWVMDIEHPASFTGLSMKRLKRKFTFFLVKRFLESKKCKKILPHVKASADILKETFNSKIINKKVEVLYPATHIPLFKKPKKDKNKIVLVSVLSLFEEKGGVVVLEVFKQLSQKYDNLELLIKADVPLKWKKKYNLKNIKYFPLRSHLLPREKLLEKFYASADIFFYPTLIDTFGYGFLDAMCCGLPIVTVNNYAVPEIVVDGKNGFVVDAGGSPKETWIDEKKWSFAQRQRIIKELFDSLVKLIENPSLRKKMSKESYYLVSKGKFSISYRNKQLIKTYKEALS